MARDFDLPGYFKNPPSQRQKQYDAVRAIVLEKQPVEMVAKRYNYKHSTIYALLRDAKAGKIELFPAVQKGKRPVNHVQRVAPVPWNRHSKAVNHLLVFDLVNRLAFLRKPFEDTSKALIR